ncbi:MAG: HEAT repeat domain-containing protein [Planctomycetota bacterium]
MKSANRAVWGTISEIREDDEDRLLRLAVSGGADGWTQRGSAALLLLDRAGRLPDGMTLWSGARGLVLWREGAGESARLGSFNGTLLAGGFLPLDPLPADRGRIEELVAAEMRRDDPPREVALRLLESPDRDCRSLALSCLRSRLGDATAAERARLGSAFRREPEGELLESFLELFLLCDLPLAGDIAAAIVIERDDPELLELGVTYLEKHGDLSDRSTLLAAFPGASTGRRLILLDAYARLRIDEAIPWWTEALLSDEPRLIRAAIRGIAQGRAPGAEEACEALLDSSSDEIRRLALSALATLGTPRATVLLREARERGGALGELAARLIRHPYRHAQLPRRHPAIGEAPEATAGGERP